METGQIVDTSYPRTSPDHIFIQGQLQDGAVGSINFRKASKAIDGLGLRWIISGSEGEIEVTIPESHLQMNAEGRTLRLRSGKKDETKIIDFEDPSEAEHVKKIKGPGANSARAYEAIAEGSGRYATFDSALETHKLLDIIARDSKFI